MTSELTQIDGPVWTPETEGYDEARLGYQRRDPHRPAYIVGATTARDIELAVRFALEKNLKVAVKASGHGHLNPLDGGVLITTDRFQAVSVDPDRRTAWIEAGATWGQVIEATARHGLAPLSGSFPGVGAIPYTLGGGLGLMARRYGYAADHVRRIEVVTPDGVLRKAEDDPDLFWALRGGHGNFAIVTRLEIDLFPVTTLYGGSLYYDLSANPNAVDTWRSWTRTVPDTVTSAVAVLAMPNIPQIPAPLRGKHVAQLQISITDEGEAVRPTSVIGAGPLGEASVRPIGDEALRPLSVIGEELVRPLREIGAPLVDSVGELAYTESARIFAEPDRPDAFRSRNALLSELDPQALATTLKQSSQGRFILAIRHLGGALARQPELPNAVGHRDAQYSLTVLTIGAADATTIHKAVLGPFADQTVGRFLNFVSADLAEAELQTAFDPGDYTRLKKLRAQYDPTHLLQPNHAFQQL